MTKAVKKQEVDGILIDNYALTRFSNLMEKEPFRVERTIEHPITYGLVLPSGSPNTEQCVRRYMRNFNHEIFERIAKHLIPIKVNKLEFKVFLGAAPVYRLTNLEADWLFKKKKTTGGQLLEKRMH